VPEVFTSHIQKTIAPPERPKHAKLGLWVWDLWCKCVLYCCLGEPPDHAVHKLSVRMIGAKSLLEDAQSLAAALLGALHIALILHHKSQHMHHEISSQFRWPVHPEAGP